jgi:biotin synthase
MMIENDIVPDESLDILKLSDQAIVQLLTSSGDLQQQLFERARTVRRQFCGDRLHIRGVIEISNYCVKKCEYCAMRCHNSAIERYRMRPEDIIAIAKEITDAGIYTVFIQSGQDLQCDSMIEQVVPAIRSMGAEVLLCLGERSQEIYKMYAGLGVRSYILKYETSDPDHYECIAHASLKGRLQCMDWIREAGMSIGTGNITCLPHQSLGNLVSDILFALRYSPDFVSTAPFIPNEGTPLHNYPKGDINLALNTIALWRIGLKNALIPTVSALEQIQPGGQLLGLMAGANVMTINFTPQSCRTKYAIYSQGRYIVSLNHVVETAKAAGMVTALGRRTCI